ncbi:MAG: GAF domain-containing protein [Bacteroidota bacterium]
MRKGLIPLNKFATKENTVESYVCFQKFIEFLEEKISTDKSIRIHFYQFALDKIKQVPRLTGGIPIAEAQQYDEILELVSCIVFPLIESEETALVGLLNGISPEAFYFTEAFSDLFKSSDIYIKKSELDDDTAKKIHKQIQYDFILQKLYRRHLPDRMEMIRSFFNEETGLYKYYRINIDTRFLDIKLKPGVSLACSDSDIAACLECSEDFSEMEKMLPLDNFIAMGFSIVTLTDITEQQAVEQLSKIVLSIDKENVDKDLLHVTRLLQTIVGSNEYQFGIMPFFTINNRSALLYENFPYSILIKASADAGIPKKTFSRYINHYTSKPGWIEYTPGSKSQLAVKLQQALGKAGIHFYGLAPVYFNDTLVGILETAAPEGVRPFSDIQFSKLVPVMPYISQLLKLSIEKFNISIDRIVKDNFTVIQPSVQWKFNEAAWHYFRSHDVEHKNEPFEKISFKDVYPLYGAVDIRNSTNERNIALRQDLECHLILLITLLEKLSFTGYEEKANEFIAACRQWLKRMEVYVSVEEELHLNDFLFGEVDSFLQTLNDLPFDVVNELKEYYIAIDETTGIAFNRRRQLENSMQVINSVTGKYLDLFKEELQAYYPCYFEKFRTDGIEYDIYIGQSIAPKIPFSIKHLHRLRSLQVQSMAAMAKLTGSLYPTLEYPLQTTQLIFVNTRSIDISFREDEKRFDVEGSYNIRYQVIKKRIDKVNIKDSNERLTQPGKIAIVYFNDSDAAEFAGYINDLQKQNVLKDDLEYLELQELQGVQGLKALRVGVAE